MGFLRILRDSAKIRGDSQGFSGFPQKPYEVSGVSSPSEKVRPTNPKNLRNFVYPFPLRLNRFPFLTFLFLFFLIELFDSVLNRCKENRDCTVQIVHAEVFSAPQNVKKIAKKTSLYTSKGLTALRSVEYLCPPKVACACQSRRLNVPCTRKFFPKTYILWQAWK